MPKSKRPNRVRAATKTARGGDLRRKETPKLLRQAVRHAQLRQTGKPPLFPGRTGGR